ncbi:predicted protein [Histoplasma capsulatum var. duboisii H88]|uniref:Predicted protein n=1 Tax=Ajellomyces capsulatus (strain H88) TaxID=544711 RepID=F0UU34_AJEC8|nr:predicted protein [Histoplasma capsulatum var. duboisii H88]
MSLAFPGWLPSEILVMTGRCLRYGCHKHGKEDGHPLRNRDVRRGSRYGKVQLLYSDVSGQITKVKRSKESKEPHFTSNADNTPHSAAEDPPTLPLSPVFLSYTKQSAMYSVQPLLIVAFRLTVVSRLLSISKTTLSIATASTSISALPFHSRVTISFGTRKAFPARSRRGGYGIGLSGDNEGEIPPSIDKG